MIDLEDLSQGDYQEDLYSDLDEVDGEIPDSEDDDTFSDSCSDDSDSVYELMDKRLDDTNELRPRKSATPDFEHDNRVKPATTVLHELGFCIVVVEALKGLELLVCTRCECVVYATLKEIEDHLKRAHWRLPGFVMPAEGDCSAALAFTYANHNALRERLDAHFPNDLPPPPHIKVESGWSCCLCADAEMQFCALTEEEMTLHHETDHPGLQNTEKLKEYCFASTLDQTRWHRVREPGHWQDHRVRAAPKLLHDLGFVVLLLEEHNLPNLLVCTLCQCAVLSGGKALRRHIRKDSPSTQSQVIPTSTQCSKAAEAIAERYNVLAPANVPKLRFPNHQAPLPFIRHVLGWSCSLCSPNEQFCCASRRVIEQHQRIAHQDSPVKLRRKDRCRISSLFSACLQWYIVNCGDNVPSNISPPAPPAPPSASLGNLYQEFDAAQETPIRAPVHNAFLLQVGWTQQYTAEEAHYLLTQVALPAKDDDLLPGLRKAVSEYLHGIKACLQSSPSTYLQPRRWINCLLAYVMLLQFPLCTC
jgi:hypothetical protein